MPGARERLRESKEDGVTVRREGEREKARVKKREKEAQHPFKESFRNQFCSLPVTDLSPNPNRSSPVLSKQICSDVASLSDLRKHGGGSWIGSGVVAGMGTKGDGGGDVELMMCGLVSIKTDQK